VLSPVIGRSYLRNLIVRLGLSSMDDIGELYRVLNEEDRDVVSNDIPVALVGVELDGETANVSHSVCRTTGSKYRRESEEDRRLARGVGQDFRTGDICGGFEEGEFTKRAGASGVHNTFWNALVVEAVDLWLSVSPVLVVGSRNHTFSLAKLSSRSIGPV
jgi:hypothetical protein